MSGRSKLKLKEEYRVSRAGKLAEDEVVRVLRVGTDEEVDEEGLEYVADTIRGLEAVDVIFEGVFELESLGGLEERDLGGSGWCEVGASEWIFSGNLVVNLKWPGIFS